MVLEYNTKEKPGSETVLAKRTHSQEAMESPGEDPHMRDLRPLICTEPPLFLPWKEFLNLTGIPSRDLSPSRAPVAIQSRKSLVLGLHLLAIRGARRHSPFMMNRLMAV